jgi:hypothetical protein
MAHSSIGSGNREGGDFSITEAARFEQVLHFKFELAILRDLQSDRALL